MSPELFAILQNEVLPELKRLRQNGTFFTCTAIEFKPLLRERGFEFRTRETKEWQEILKAHGIKTCGAGFRKPTDPLGANRSNGRRIRFIEARLQEEIERRLAAIRQEEERGFWLAIKDWPPEGANY